MAKRGRHKKLTMKGAHVGKHKGHKGRGRKHGGKKK